MKKGLWKMGKAVLRSYAENYFSKNGRGFYTWYFVSDDSCFRGAINNRDHTRRHASWVYIQKSCIPKFQYTAFVEIIFYYFSGWFLK